MAAEMALQPSLVATAAGGSIGAGRNERGQQRHRRKQEGPWQVVGEHQQRIDIRRRMKRAGDIQRKDG
jgi:hypothetical protein